MVNKSDPISFNPTEIQTITRLSGLKYNKPRVKFSDRCKIELDLKDAFKLADLLDTDSDYWEIKDCQFINLVIKKLRNAEPEIQF